MSPELHIYMYKFSKISKISHYAKPITIAKWSVWLKKFKTKKRTKNKSRNLQKHAENVSRTSLQLFFAKSGSSIHLIFEK